MRQLQLRRLPHPHPQPRLAVPRGRPPALRLRRRGRQPCPCLPGRRCPVAAAPAQPPRSAAQLPGCCCCCCPQNHPLRKPCCCRFATPPQQPCQRQSMQMQMDPPLPLLLPSRRRIHPSLRPRPRTTSSSESVGCAGAIGSAAEQNSYFLAGDPPDPPTDFRALICPRSPRRTSFTPLARPAPPLLLPPQAPRRRGSAVVRAPHEPRARLQGRRGLAL